MVSWLPDYNYRMMTEILQERLGILIKKRKRMKHKQMKKESLLSYSPYLETQVKESGMLYEKVLCYAV